VKPSSSIVTCLINACAESPFPEYGLERLNWLRQHLKISYNFKFNKVHYNAAIKAYGKLGQLEEASKLIKEMIENQIFPETDTFNMLLIGCASNKNAGSTLALKVYKRMKLYEIRPNVTTYRLILRCIRDCGMGSSQLFQQTIEELPAMTTLDQNLVYKSIKKRVNKSEVFEWAPLLSELGESIETAVKVTSNSEKSLKSSDSESSLTIMNLPHDQTILPTEYTRFSTTQPNLLSGDHLDLICRIEAIQFDKLQNRVGRLLLFGGMHGFLKTMIDDQCKPDND
jgi:pentatricopeptide repeat protein